VRFRLFLASAGAVLAMAIPAAAQAASANPSSVNYGNVPINTTATATIAVTPDPGYAVELASGSGLNPPFGFNFGTCSGSTGTCNVIETFRPTSNASSSGTITVDECPTGGGVCIGINVPLQGVGVTTPRVSSPPSLDFGAQTTGQAGPVRWLQVQNSGSASLQFGGPPQITGPNASDFSIPAGDDTCSGQTFEIWQSCWIGVRFTAGAAGARTATLAFGTNNASTLPPGTVSLTGTGVAANSGPAGANGSNGSNGSNGATGAQGPAGKGGQVELVTCTIKTRTVFKKIHGKRKRVKVHKKVCTTKLVTGPVKFVTQTARR
jgi:hypothetical protein